MDAMHAARKGTLIRDLLIFQGKLVLDGAKDVFLIQAAFFAVAYDLLFGRSGRPQLFYSLLRLSERFDLWLNLHGASERAEQSGDGLFGASRAGSNSLLGKLEEMVRGGPEAARGPTE